MRVFINCQVCGRKCRKKREAYIKYSSTSPYGALYNVCEACYKDKNAGVKE
jgi:hypothetical protein